MDDDGVLLGVGKCPRTALGLSMRLWRRGVFAPIVIYAPSASSFVYTATTLPALHGSLTDFEWAQYTFILAGIGWSSLFDLGLVQLIPRIVIRGATRQDVAAIHRYFFIVGPLVALGLALLLFCRFEDAHTSLFAISIAGSSWLAITFVNTALISTLQARRRNYWSSGISSAATLLKLASVLLGAQVHIGLSALLSIIAAISLCEMVGYCFAGANDFFVSCKATERFSPIPEFHFASAMALVSGGIIAQSDRIFLAWLLPPNQFGNYVLISSFCLMFLSLQYPLLRYINPRMYGPNGVNVLYKKFAFCATAFAGLIFVLSAPYLFRFWLRKSDIDQSMTEAALILLAAGAAVQAVYNVLYQGLVMQGRWSTIVRVNVIAIVASLFVVLVLTIGIEVRDIRLGGVIWITFAASQSAAYLFLNGGRIGNH